MSTPRPRSPRNEHPTPDDLAGTPICLEDDQSPSGSGGSKLPKAVRTRGSTRGPSGHAIEAPPPTADDLAGIPIIDEAAEDLTVRPSKRKH
jgi:hypothetical protein